MKLRDYLIKMKISQAEFSQMVDIGRSHLSLIICGKRSCGARLATRIEVATNGTLKAGDIRSGVATGYEGDPKRVSGRRHRKSDGKKQKTTGRKILSLL